MQLVHQLTTRNTKHVTTFYVAQIFAFPKQLSICIAALKYLLKTVWAINHSCLVVTENTNLATVDHQSPDNSHVIKTATKSNDVLSCRIPLATIDNTA